MKGAAEGTKVWIIPVENQIRTDSSEVDIYLLLVEEGGGKGWETCQGERREERGGGWWERKEVEGRRNERGGG